jgi:DNA-binding NarL/FixJ family response regulator
MTTYRIVIIDDQHEVRHMLATGLRLLGPHFDVLEVLSAEEGFLLALRGAVDLLVTDVRLPGISGLELVKKLKLRNPKLKIILITGMQENEIRQQVADAQVDAYFYKPIVMDEFIRAVLHCLGIEQEDQLHALEDEEEQHSLDDEVAPDSPENLPERLYALRTRMNAHAALILDRDGRVLAQSGEYPLLFSEPNVLSSLIAAWNAAEKCSLALGMDLPANLLSLAGSGVRLLLTHAGKQWMLVVIFPDSQFKEDWTSTLSAAQDDLAHILSAIEMPVAVQGLSSADVLAEPSESDMPDVEVLLKQLDQVEVNEDADAFWEQAVERGESSGPDTGGALSYEQARKLGLTPQGDEQQDRLP